MADGSYLPIGAIEIGDYVAATDPETGETYAEPVLDVISGYGTKHIVEIDTDLDPTTPPLQATAEHPLWVVGKGWVKAADVKVGDAVASLDGSERPVTSVRNRGELSSRLVFNLNVGDVHTFSVKVGGLPALTHNANTCAISQQKQARHVRGTKEFKQRARSGKGASAFFGWKSARKLVNHAWKHGRVVEKRPGKEVRELEFGFGVGTDSWGRMQTRVRVHRDSKGRIHGHPSGPWRR
ncbi:polymorphic toxin-type HINT domain-containing protein [Streptomyces sp. NPDC006706]|uniref:polymorphic toxin-type HINT domain-containing protein n=1 Tax=Streptomyces sp. NPDC006706 TaxID=3364761 RepID=UPI0036A9EB36